MTEQQGALAGLGVDPHHGVLGLVDGRGKLVAGELPVGVLGLVGGGELFVQVLPTMKQHAMCQ